MAASNPNKGTFSASSRANARKRAANKVGQYGVGKYKGKTANLSEKQIKKAGAAKAAKSKVDIEKTKWVAGKGAVDAATGKKISGRVNIGNGKVAVYKNGRRVTAPAKKAAASSSSRSPSSSSSTSSRVVNKTEPPKPGERRRGPNGKMNVFRGGKWVPTAARVQTAKDRAMVQGINSKPVAAAPKKPSTYGTSASSQVPTAKRTYANGAAPSSKTAKASGNSTGNPIEWALGRIQNAAAGSGKKPNKPQSLSNPFGALASAAAGSNKPGATKPQPKPKPKGSQVPDVGGFLSGLVSGVGSAAAGKNKKKK